VSLKSELDILKLAHELEQQAVNAYVSAVPKSASGDLAHAAARISADEVTHFTVLTQVLGGELPKEALTFGA
jgi:rubrerythrin